MTEDRTSEVTSFGDACYWSGVTDSDRPAWLERRRSLLTASETAAVLGEDTRSSAFKVYWDKVQPGESLEFGIESPAFWGRILEGPILTAVADYYGWEHRRGGALLISRKYPWLGATLDYEIDRGLGHKEPFEGKTTAFMLRGDWNELTGDMPNRVVLQVQHQLLVTQAESAAVFCLVGGQGACLIDVEPEPELHTIIVEESERFLDMVKRRLEPPPGPNDTSTLDRIYPDRGNGIVKLGKAEVEWAREVMQLSEEIKLRTSRKKSLLNAIKRSIGNATWGRLPEPVGGASWMKWYQGKDSVRLLKNGPLVTGELPTALPVALNELPAPETDFTQITRAALKKRRKARR